MNDTAQSPAAHEAQRIRIGAIDIDLRFRCLKRSDGAGDDEVELPHRVFELLLLFVAEPHVLHTRQRLLERVWSGLVVEDANLSQSVWMLRRALGPASKDWIRTVSKKGYVFEPSEPISRLPASSSPRVASASVDVTSVEATDDEAGVSGMGHGMASAASIAPMRTSRRTWAVAVMLVLACLSGAFAGLRAWQAPATSASRYVLIDATRSDPDAQARLPARMLEAWLGWKLAMCPETRAVSPSEWAMPSREPTAIVLLGSGPVSGRKDRIFVQARIEVGDARLRIHREGSREELAGLVDEVSIAALDALLPARSSDRWPVLRLDPAMVPRYLAFRDARLAHRWADAGARGEALLRDAPGFELARLELAQTQAARGQLPQANALLDAALARLQPLPEDARAQVQAYRLGLSPDHAGAARAYAALANAHPHRPQFAIQQARALARTGRFADGLAVLDRMRSPETLAPEHAIARWISLAGLRVTAGNLEGARASARAGVRLAEAQGWPQERGHALMALANADIVATDGREGAKHFDAAARAFDEAGDGFSALHARAIAELHGPPVAGEPVHLDPWLARARAAGQRQIELDALRIAAHHHLRGGDMARYRERLRQAQALSDAMGDHWGSATLAVDRLEDDFARGDLAAVERGLARLAGSGLQGEPMLRARQIDAWAALDRGEFQRALAALDRGERDALGGPGASAAAAGSPLACTRGSALVRMGRPGQARTQFARCREAGEHGALTAAIGLAELEWISGDREAGLAQSRTARILLQRIRTEPDRWSASIDLAGALVRLGDPRAAQALLRDVVPKVETSGLRRDAARARVVLAEAALADGDPVRAGDHARRAHAAVARDAWQPQLQQIDIALVRMAGDDVDARRRVLALHRDAHRRGDVMQQTLVHSRLQGGVQDMACTTHAREALVAQSGFRGADLDWLEGRASLPDPAEARPMRTLSRLD